MTARTLAEIEPDAPASATLPRLLNAKQVADLLQVSRRHLSRLVHTGEFPKPLLLIGRRPRWAASDFNAYVAKLRAARPKRRHNG